MDKVTRKETRIRYIKVYVEIEMKDGFMDKLELEMLNGEVIIVKVEYPWRPIACKWLSPFGHEKNHCMQAPNESPNGAYPSR